MEKVTTGLPRLDRLLDGGLPSKTVILVSGEAGSGKTLFGLNFVIDGASKNEKCCYVSACDDKEELLRACDEIDALKDVKKYIGKNLIFKGIPLGNRIDLNYFTKIFLSYPKVDRLIIDNVNKLLIHAKNNKEYRIKLSELVKCLKDRVNCALLICETKRDEIDTGNGEAFECDGVIHLSFLELEEKPLRILEVHKLRYTSFEPKIPHELIIDRKGLRLSGTKII
jgi:KaiC/GvpD/RAD55 family RecA-like ATPase